MCTNYVPGNPDGSIEINGVTLPHHVVMELRELGMPLLWYSRGELTDAVEACAYDRSLIANENGVHFHDKLKHEEPQISTSLNPYRRKKMRVTTPEQPSEDKPHFFSHFCENIICQRDCNEERTHALAGNT